MTKRTIWLVILLFITNICSFSSNKLDWSSTKYKDVDEWIKFGKKHLRRTYRNGGVGPYAFDCSGFTMYMYKELGYALPHSSSAQSDHGEKIKATHVKPGDLVFYSGSKGSKIGHVGIVIEVTDEDFSFIHASLKQGICIDKSTHPYYKSRYKTARRIYDMSSGKSKKRDEEETLPEPTPQPKEEELELPGQTTDIDTPSNDNTVDNNNSVDSNKQTVHQKKKKESRRERRKREKAEKQRLEKQRLEKEKEDRKKQENARKNTNQNTKKEVVKEDKKDSLKKEEQPVVTKKTHIVEKGETMYRISKMAGLTVDELKELNGLTSNDLKIGQVLIIEK